MNVSGIRPNAGFYQYNSIKLNELRNQQIEEAKKAQLLLEEQEAKKNEIPAFREDELAAGQQDARERQTFDAFDFAKQYKAGEEYELKGADSDLNSLDVEKAISTMQKDQVLKQYQFFVRNKESEIVSNRQAATIQRTGENFVL